MGILEASRRDTGDEQKWYLGVYGTIRWRKKESIIKEMRWQTSEIFRETLESSKAVLNWIRETHESDAKVCSD